MNKEGIVFLCGNGNYQQGSKILADLRELFGQRCAFSHINFNKYVEGELDNRIVNYKNLRGKTVVVFQSTYSESLFDEVTDIIWACKHQYGAERIIAIIPFMWNRRQDPIMSEGEKERWSKKVAKPDEIQRLRKNIHFLSTCGVDELLVATPHSSEMEKSCQEFGIKFHEIDPSKKFAETIQTYVSNEEDQNLLRVYAPDAGSIPRAVNLARILNCPVLFNLKNRAINNRTCVVDEAEDEVKRLVIEFREYYKFEKIDYVTPELVDGTIICMVEDEVASGGTANDTGQVLYKNKAKSIILLATHAVLTNGWRNKLLFSNPFSKIIMTDTIPRGYDKRTGGLIYDISLSKFFASSLYKILDSLK